MAPPISILDSFNKDIPHLNRDSDKIKYKSVGESSETTKACVPPRVLLCSRPDGECKWIKSAENTLRKLSNTDFENKELPFVFPELALNTEAELSSAADNQVLLPIFEILHKRWGCQFICRKETSPEKVDGSMDTSMRFDIVYETANGKELIMVLELKRRELIRYSDFALSEDDACPSGLMADDSSLDAIQKRLGEIKRSAGKFAWDDNAIPYLKQVCKYANGTSGKGCPYVALFNWDHLLLFKFDEANLGSKKAKGVPTAGETAELTWISEHNAVHNRDSGGFIRKAGIRKALLGFMLEAFEARLGPGKTH